MYYIKWKKALTWDGTTIAKPYFKGFGGRYSWGEIREAVPFSSAEEAKIYISKKSHWLDYVEYQFIHPLNFQRLKDM